MLYHLIIYRFPHPFLQYISHISIAPIGSRGLCPNPHLLSFKELAQGEMFDLWNWSVYLYKEVRRYHVISH